MSYNRPRDHTQMQTRVEWIGTTQRITEIADQWRSIATDPFSSPEWLVPWWEAFCNGRTLRTCALWRGEELVGLAPMAERSGYLESLSNDHTPYFEVCARDETARRELVHALISRAQRGVVWDALSATGPTWAALRGEMPGGRLAVRERHVSPIVDTSVGLEAFRAASRPRWSAPIERLRRKMVRENDATLHLLQQPPRLDQVLTRGFTVEASGWKGRAGTAILCDPRAERFYRTMAESFAANGQLVVSWLSFGQEMVAFDLCLLAGGRLFLLKTAFDERFRRLAPGLVLRLSVIERCAELGLSAHELLGDDYEWKRKFARSERRHLEARFYPRDVRGTTAWAYREYARPLLRAGYRRVTGHDRLTETRRRNN